MKHNPGRVADAPWPRLRSLLPPARVLGIRVDRLRLPDLLEFVTEAVAQRARITVLYANVHCVNTALKDPAYAAHLEAADLVYCDGTGVRLAACLTPERIPERMTGADWIDDLCRLCLRSELSLFLMGGEPGVAEGAAAVLRHRYPRLKLLGCAAGFDLQADLVGHINKLAPDILLVGMGTPRQEKWIAANRDALDVPVVWAVGALFAFVSGRVPRGPRWMTDHGLEWVCRLAAEPRKLWRRYLIGNPQFLWRVLREYCLRRL